MSPVVREPRSGGFNLGDYVEVKERIPLFYEAFPEGRLVTAKVKVKSTPDGKPRVWVKAKAYRTPDDPHPAVGWSWMELPGTTSYTRGSELENTETSAWGRAIAALGIGIKHSIATKNEIEAKSGDSRVEGNSGDGGSLIGRVSIGDAPADFELRETAEGNRVSFKLIEGKHGIRVDARGLMVDLLLANKGALVDKNATCWGTIGWESFKKGSATIRFRTLALTRIQCAGLDLAEPDEPDSEMTDAELAALVPIWDEVRA